MMLVSRDLHDISIQKLTKSCVELTLHSMRVEGRALRVFGAYIPPSTITGVGGMMEISAFEKIVIPWLLVERELDFATILAGDINARVGNLEDFKMIDADEKTGGARRL